MTDDLNTARGRNLTAMTMWSWARVFNAPINEVAEQLPGLAVEFVYVF